MTDSRISQQRDDVRFRILALVERNPEISQRDLARELGVSLGSVNYCIKALLDKGLIKLENFRASKHKLGYVYCLTPEGIAQRRDLASSFVERKRAEYEAIKAELEQLSASLLDPSGSAPHWDPSRGRPACHLTLRTE